MISSRPKRPSSARRNLKHETFSPFVSGSRLRHVQSLLSDGTKATQGLPDALLCIAGIDSRYNDGMSELINYLLFGFFELRKAELEGSGFDEEIIDDVFFVIHRDKVDVYCNPVNYHYLLPYVSHWRNVFFHCLTESQYDDEEVAEDFKISTFVSLVKDSQIIGIPFSNSGNHHTFDKMLIEKWPIIQVYGVEGVGGGGFFTMVHDVEDVSEQVHQLYHKMDPVALEVLIMEQVSKLERQWNTMLSTIEVTLNKSSAIELSEEKVFEPLRSFYVHGRVSGGGNNVGSSSRVPYVLFGSNTTHQTIQSVLKGGNSIQGGDLRSTRVSETGFNFMVCKAVSPRGPLNCTRTYFFTREFVNPFQDAKVSDYEQNTDLRLLIHLYSAIVDGVLTGIQAYCNTLSIKHAETIARATVTECCAVLKDEVITTYLKDTSHLQFTFNAVDSNGSVQNVGEGERSLLVKCVSISMYDIPSLVIPGTVLGSLQFSESFLDSIIKVKNDDGSVSLNSSYLLLTDHIPRYKTWAFTSLETDRKYMEGKLEGDSLRETFGDLLLPGEPVNIGCSSTLCLPPEEASLYAFENGLVIVCPYSGAIVLHGNHIRSAVFYDGETINTVATLVLEYQTTFLPYLPFHLQSGEGELVLLFTPKSKAYKHLFSKVLHNWRSDAESDSPKVQRVDTLPEQCTLMHTILQHRFITTAPTSKVRTALQKSAVSLPFLYSFLDHFAVSSVGDYPIPTSDLSKVLQMSEDMTGQEHTETEVVVTILSGVPGSHQDTLCDVLSRLSKDQNRYVVLKPSLDGTGMFNPLDIQAKLKATMNVHRRRKQGQLLMRNTRVLYIVPGYTDIVSVVRAIECHPDPDVRQHCFIGSVTACVDPLNTFMEHKYTLPSLLNVCAQGWVNQIIMTSSTTVKNEDLEDIQHMLRSVNSDVAFLLVEQGQVTRSMDIDSILSENSFGQSVKVRARHLGCPGWIYGVNKPLMSTLQIKFNLPLDRNKLVNKLRGLKSSLTPYPFTDNIYNIQGKVKFVGQKEEEPMEVQFCTMNGTLTIQPITETVKEKSLNRGSFITFTGCQNTQAKLKDWLRECAPQKPEKKSLITRKDITRDEVNKIHKQHHLDSLPEGWFYNGTQYVSFDGTKQNLHPNLEEFVGQVIGEKNGVIEEFNARVDEMVDSYRDLFS